MPCHASIMACKPGLDKARFTRSVSRGPDDETLVPEPGIELERSSSEAQRDQPGFFPARRRAPEIVADQALALAACDSAAQGVAGTGHVEHERAAVTIAPAPPNNTPSCARAASSRPSRSRSAKASASTAPGGTPFTAVAAISPPLPEPRRGSTR